MYLLKNKVQLIGIVADLPIIKLTPEGKHARLSMGTTEAYKNHAGEKVTETQWHSITATGEIAEKIEKFIVKGSEIAVEGRLTHRTYTDTDEKIRYITEVQVTEILLIGTPEPKA